jgi:hypothetical protein
MLSRSTLFVMTALQASCHFSLAQIFDIEDGAGYLINTPDMLSNPVWSEVRERLA